MERNITHIVCSKESFIRNVLFYFNYHFKACFPRELEQGDYSLTVGDSGQLCREIVVSSFVLIITLLGMRESSQAVHPL